MSSWPDGRARPADRVKPVVRFFSVVAIVAGTAGAMYGIARYKNEALAGGVSYPLDSSHAPAFAGWAQLIARLRAIGALPLSAELERLREEGKVRVAPAMDPGRRAIWVSSLGVDAVYVAERELTWPPERLYPRLQAPPLYRETFARLSLSGTLAHELAHARGVISEGGAYQLEIEWLQSLRAMSKVRALPPEQREAWEQAADAAIANATRAREQAIAQGG